MTAPPVLSWDVPLEMLSTLRGHIIEDEEEFLNDLAAFHQRRGTSFDRDAKVSGRPVSLHQLYKVVMTLGGYDKLAAERLAFRQLVKPFNLGPSQEPAMTFQLKTVYYKNLAAYEIERYWHETAPPREILEDLTAKGGDLRNRRLENFVRHSNAASVDGGAETDDEESAETPRRDRMEIDESASGTRYSTRQLRQDPKRTQIYQPDPTPSRSRYGHLNASPQPSAMPPHQQLQQQQYVQPAIDPRNPNFTVDKYEPRQPIALTLRPVTTPGYNADMFYQRKAMIKAQRMPRIPPDPKWLDQIRHCVVQQYFNGPSIYHRCHLGIMSGIKVEEDFALHHLVKVSYERGDKFTFAGFPALAETLIGKCLQISSVIYGVDWQVAYDLEEGAAEPGTLNGCFGTPGLREAAIAAATNVDEQEIEDDVTIEKLERLNEAALIIRNMATLESNAAFLSSQQVFKDMLIIATNLPRWARLIEFRQYALEMAEQATRYWALPSDDPLYLSLLDEVRSDDRGRILSALRAISRIGVETEHTFRVDYVSESLLERLVAFTLLDDDELVEATLDFLYEFTAIPENVITSLKNNPTLLPSVVPQLQEYLLHNATPAVERIQNRPHPSTTKAPSTIPSIPHDLYLALLQYPEPDRSSRWLRCCFQESPEDDITQIAIWQAYQQRFSHPGAIAAAEFIKNVSSTFSQAQAQVINAQPQPRFIIKGIKPRRVLIDMQGRPFWKCPWEVAQTYHNAQVVYDDRGLQRHICGSWHDSRLTLWGHILQHHLGLKYDTATSKFESSPEMDTLVADKKCCWIGCARQTPITTAREMSIHIRGHIPQTNEIMNKIIEELATMPYPNGIGKPGAKGRSLAGGEPDMYTKHTFYHTVVDDRGHPAGIPFMAVMVLRNLARFVGRYGGKVALPGLTVGSSKNRSEAEIEVARKQTLMGRFFTANVRKELWNVIFVHRTLGTLVQDLVTMVDKGEQGEKKRGEEHVDGAGYTDYGEQHDPMMLS